MDGWIEVVSLQISQNEPQLSDELGGFNEHLKWTASSRKVVLTNCLAVICTIAVFVGCLDY
jgi:hypothetical protein